MYQPHPLLKEGKVILYLREMAGIYLPKGLASMCINEVIDKPEFMMAPGGQRHHHNYPNGLAEHTAEVLDHALHMTTVGPGGSCCDLDVLVTAAIFHDFCKTLEYRFSATKTEKIVDESVPYPVGGVPFMKSVPAIEVNDYKSTIGHVTGSAMYFQRCFNGWTRPAMPDGSRRSFINLSELPRSFEEHVTHCILSHHGRFEWGSPVEPRTHEAWLLHAADMLSSRGGALAF